MAKTSAGVSTEPAGKYVVDYIDYVLLTPVLNVLNQIVPLLASWFIFIVVVDYY